MGETQVCCGLRCQSSVVSSEVRANMRNGIAHKGRAARKRRGTVAKCPIADAPAFHYVGGPRRASVELSIRMS
eukprot:185776-Prymnesium_polylepis.1